MGSLKTVLHISLSDFEKYFLKRKLILSSMVEENALMKRRKLICVASTSLPLYEENDLKKKTVQTPILTLYRGYWAKRKNDEQFFMNNFCHFLKSVN